MSAALPLPTETEIPASRLLRELAVLRKFASDIWDSVEGGYSADAAARFEWIRDDLHELIETDEVGDSCSYCSGWDDRTDEARSCSECHHGRVLR